MSIEPPIRRETYPAIHFIRRHGAVLAVILGMLVGAAGLAATLAGAGWWWTLAGIAAGGLTFLLMKSYCELVRVIAATLLPD